MFYRRKIILALIQKFGGKLKRTPFQKLLFIFTRFQSKPSFEFVPHKYGPFSFRARADKHTMIGYNLLEKNDDWVLKSNVNYIEQLKEKDRVILRETYYRFGNYSTPDLIRHTYREFPFYAIRSEIAEELMDQVELQRIGLFRPVSTEKKLYTIGYEGIEAEEYMNRLLKKEIHVLADVRKNSISMKFGFSKKQLKSMCEKMGIYYIHVPELGIESQKRKNLDTKSDYLELFEEYNQEILPAKRVYLEEIYNYYIQYDRVAITCFEKDHTCCHRHKISNYMHEVFGISVEHL